MSAFFQRFRHELRSGVTIGFWTVLMLVVAVTGPFDTYAAYSFEQRLLGAIPLLTVTMIVGVSIRVAVFSTLPQGLFRWTAALNASLASVVIGPMLDMFLHSIPPVGTVRDPGLGALMLLVFSLSLGLASLRRTIPTEPALASVAPRSTPAPAEAPRLPRLLQRLDVSLPCALWAISVRDHYVDVQTDFGVNCLLMRLGDAMAETDPVEGAQIHRSHWVAWQAVRGVARDGSKVFVVLVDDSRLPVSKNHRNKLVARGLL